MSSFLLLFSSLLSFAQVDLNLGLKAYYTFNGNTNDISGNNNNPVFNNAVLTADRWGNPNSAYHFNGTDNYMRIPNSPSINTNNTLSICVFVRPTGYYAGPCHGNSIVMKGDNDYLPGNYLLRFDDNFYTSGGNCTIGTPDFNHQNFYAWGVSAPPPGYLPYIQTNDWHSVIATYDGTVGKLYIDCELKMTSPQNGLTFTNVYDLFLGTLNNPSFPYWFNGDMDDVRIYDRALNFDEVKAISDCGTITNCNDWLQTQLAGQSVKIGDLDISGNQITVEASINRTAPYSGPYIYAGDIVSKHTDPSDANYLLRPNDAEITTSNGYFVTPPICDIELNKTYHIALVYDGSELKFYRDGFLMSQVAASGTLFQNNLVTTIGDWANYSVGVGTNFIGNINEVRIWNVARTQSELRAYMNSSLPNPAIQTGLQAYYSFNDLTNKQGNAAWNGILNGGASINNTNSNCSFESDSCNAIITTTSFTVPDTVCVNTPVQVTNTSVGTSNYYWSFCETDFSTTPDAVNLGNPSGALSWPVFTDLVKDDDGNYYGFVVNNFPAGLSRFNFGNSLLNVPTVDVFGTVGGVLSGNAEGIQVNKVAGNWIAVIVGGSPSSGQTPYIATINFGPAITNLSPTGTNWGNVGNLDYPIDLVVFTENNNWYGYTVSTLNNSITRFNFGSDFSSVTGVNLGNIGNLNTPVGIGQVKEGNNWYLFITNELGNTLTRLDFGNSLLNAPVGTNIGDPGNLLHKPRDISFINLCDGITALVVNGETNEIIKLDFQNNLAGAPTASSLGNLGNLDFPHSISELFRVDGDIYAFIPNVNNYTFTRIRFPGCTGIPGSALQNPGPVTYTQPGNYNIHLVTDIGLPTQASFCKKVVVQDCSVQTIINDYTPILALNPCNNSLTVENASEFNIGDTVLLIQMKGAVINLSNSLNFGDVQDYKNAGNYEFNYVKNKTGNIIELTNKLTRQYDIPVGKVQLIRVPYYTTLNTTSILTCLPWDGNKGGVLAFNVRDTLALNADIDVSGKGLKGGKASDTTFLNANCDQTDFYFPDFSVLGAMKGENIAEIQPGYSKGRGAPSNGGGGGQDHNSGGGGGANVSAGGYGGYQWETCGSAPFDNRGIGGKALPYSNIINRVFLGGGGGSGHYNNGEFNPDGANGGGLIIITTNKLIANGNNIKSNGSDAVNCIGPAGDQGYCHEGMGGGGGAGTILIDLITPVDNIGIQTNGGKGGDMSGLFPGRLGPGGGGGGGVVWLTSTTLPANINIQNTGGLNGVCVNSSNDPWGATPGSPGVSFLNLVIPVDNIPFKPNIDSVRIQDNAISCSGFNFNGIGYTNTSGVISWDWDFGDASYAHTQNTSHTYTGTGPYNVRLVGTDINGCKDSITTAVIPVQLAINAGTDTSFCSNIAVSHILHGNTTGTGYTWQPSVLLDNNTLQNPTATVLNTTTFYLTSSNASFSCSVIDSVKITVNPVPAVSSINDFSICKRDSMLLTTLGNATTYQWTPPLSVNNPTISSPYFTDTISRQLIITGTYPTTGCFAKDTVNVIIKPIPDIRSIADTSLCGPHNVTLNTTGGQTYSWSPATGISNPGIANPLFTGTTTQTYTVTGTGVNACKAKDTVTITVNAIPVLSTINNTIICRGDILQLLTNSNAETNHWLPALSVNNPNTTNPYFIDTVSQTMTVTGTNTSTGCFSSTTVDITVKPIPDIQSIPDTSLCGPHNVTLNTNGGQSYSWSPAAGLSNTGIGNPVFTGTSTQTYTVTGTGTNACQAKDTVTITVNAIPVLSTINNSIICRGDILQLLTNSNAQTNHWSPALSVNDPNVTSPYFIDSVSQIMTVTGTNTSTGCFSSSSVNITVKPLPYVKTIDDFTSCATNTVTLTTTGAQSYSWSPATNLDDPGNADPVFTGTAGQYIYYVTGTASNGCIAKDTVNITIASKPVFTAPENKSICVNQSVQLNGNNGTTYQYLWSPAVHLSNTGIINPLADPLITTIYTLLITDHVCNYDSSFNVRVTVDPLPSVNATKSNDLDCAKPESQLTGSGAIQYNWTPATALNNSSIYNPVASPDATTQYTVTGTDNNGCTNKDTVTIYVKGGKYFGFNIPNSFTPNGDGLNDCFGVTWWGETKNFHLIIYSRWGEKVFETNNVSECWDGNYKGQRADAGNYVYYLTGETLCGNVTRKGNVLLIR